MAPRFTDGSTIQPFEIHAKNPLVVLNAKRSGQVDFEIKYHGSVPQPSAEARLVVDRRNWLQSLVFWRRPKNRRPPASLSWLDLPDPQLNGSSKEPGQVSTLRVSINVPVNIEPGDYEFQLAVVDERGRILAQSDPVLIQVKSQPFTIRVIKPKTRQFTLLFRRQKECQFQVYNTTARTLEGRVRLTPHPLDTPRRLFGPPGGSLDSSWLSSDELAEQPYPSPDENGRVYHVRVQAPPKTPPGIYQFSLDAAEASNPDENFTPGPVITLRIPAFPWALVIALVVLLLLGGGVWLLRSPSLVITSSLGVDATSILPAPTSEAIEPQASPAVPTDQTFGETANPDGPTDQRAEIEPQPDIFAGSLVTYTITVTNQKGLPVLGRSPARSRDVGELVDTLGDGAVFEKNDTGFSKDCSGDGQTITCRLPKTEQIQGGKEYAFTLVARITPVYSGDMAHTLSLGNTEKTFITPVKRKSGLKLTWLENPEVGNQDQALEYRFRVETEGPSQSDQVTLQFKPLNDNSTSIAGFMTLEPIDSSACKQLKQVVCETGCQQVKFVECKWDSLAPGNSQEITVRSVPGPGVSGKIINTVTLTEAGKSITETRILSVNPSHKMKVSLDARKETDETDESLVYTITVTNDMDFPVSGPQVDFRLPDQLALPVGLSDITPVERSAITPDKCWVSVEPPRTSPTETDPRPSPEKWVHCTFKTREFKARDSLSIEVKTNPPEDGTYQSYVEVDSQGFKSLASNLWIWTKRIVDEYALRLDGSQLLSVPLLDITTTQLKDNFEAQVLFYYDGNTEGRILGIGDRDGMPGWSINVQERILTLRVSQATEPLRCLLDVPANDGNKWLTVKMRVENLAVKGTVQAGKGNAEKECGALKLATEIAYEGSGPLVIGGADGTGKNYQGAVVFVQLADLKSKIIGKWEFGAGDAVGNSPIIDQSAAQQHINLPEGKWAWVPTQSTVLMPEQYTSDNTWKANNAAGSDWLSREFQDDTWSYAWDMPGWGTWIQSPVPDARWIWAVQPYTFPTTPSCLCSCSCKGLFKCSCSCGCTTNQPGFPAASTVYLRKVIDLPGNPVKATVQAAVDDSFSIYANQVVQGSCPLKSGDYCYNRMQEYDLTDNLHMGDNVIAIQAINSSGPAGVLVIIDIDYYKTYLFP